MLKTSARPTLHTVAERCGYSANTVSRALRNDTRLPADTIEKIQAAAAEVGYIPNRLASSLRSSNSHTVAIIIEDIENPHYSHLMARINLELRTKGFTTMILCNNKDLTTETELASLAVSYSVAGVLLFPQDSSAEAGSLNAISILQMNKIPVVLVDRVIPSINVDCVRIDDYRGGYCAAENMIKLGHHNFLYMAGPVNSSSQNLREKGLRDALRDYSIPDAQLRIIPSEQMLPAIDAGAVYELLKPIDYTSIISFNDIMAYFAMTALSKEGYRIPDDISICGFDNINIDNRYLPGLSSVGHRRGTSIATSSVNLLLERVENVSNDPTTVILPVDFFENGSCKEAISAYPYAAESCVHLD